MSPQEKADELIDKMYYIGRYDDKEDYNPAMAWERAKQCALIAVDEIVKALKYPPKANENRQIIHIETLKYWQDVKTEIEKL